MIEYLEKLVEEKEYEKALAYAEQMLLNPDNTSWDLMIIYTRLCQARLEAGESYGAQVAGQLAAKMARELEAWEYFGLATLVLGTASFRLRQPEVALAAWYDYLAYISYYGEATKKYHVMVLYNIGFVQAQNGQHEESLRTLQRAAEVANALADHRKAHGIRHALIDAHLRCGNFEEIPALLAKCAYYLRHNTSANNHMQSRLWHLVLRVRFAVATNRPQRAIRVASYGLRISEGWPLIGYELHLLLAHVYERLGNTQLALEEAVRARSAAIEARRYDLEFSAANYVYELLASNTDFMDALQGTGLEDWDPSVID